MGYIPVLNIGIEILCANFLWRKYQIIYKKLYLDENRFKSYQLKNLTNLIKKLNGYYDNQCLSYWYTALIRNTLADMIDKIEYPENKSLANIYEISYLIKFIKRK